MPKDLLILRHGEASSDSSETDFDRPLTPRGVMSCHVVAHELMKRDLLPDLIISSSAVRTTQTVLRVCKQARIPTNKIQWNPGFYNCDVDTWVNAIRQTPETLDRLLVVGHNPTLKVLCELLSGGPIKAPDRGSLLPPATLLHLSCDGDWCDITAASAKLLSVHRPSANMAVFDPDH